MSLDGPENEVPCVFELKSKPNSENVPRRAIRTLGRKFFRLTGVKSYVRSDGFWWYRWHPDAGIGFVENWEKPLETFLLRQGYCFVDIGSHVGRWTVRASPFYERIYAFEPDPFTNAVLRRNITRNDIRNVAVFATALSNHRGQVALFRFGPLACNSLRQTHVSGQAARPGKLVDVRPLDDFSNYFRKPMVVKIDVEGEELNVLKGAAGTIEKFRPLIVVEVHFADEFVKVLEELRSHQYSALNPLGPDTSDQWPRYLIARPPEELQVY